MQGAKVKSLLFSRSDLSTAKPLGLEQARVECGRMRCYAFTSGFQSDLIFTLAFV